MKIDLSPFRPRERAALEPPEDISCSEWAERFRVLDGGAAPGPWRNEKTPYLVGIMDAFSDPLIQKISILKPVQAGGTEVMKNMAAFAIDQDPADIMWAIPRREDLNHFQERRFLPMVTETPRLQARLGKDRSDVKKKEVVFDRCSVWFRAATSKADLASDPCRYVIGDEVDKWHRWTEDEGDPIRLLEDRTTTFWNRKIVLASTPSTAEGHIWRSYLQSDQRSFYVPCPHCGGFQRLSFSRQTLKLKDPKERDPHRILEERLAYYECKWCEKPIEDNRETHRAMLCGGVWAQQKAQVSRKGKVTDAHPSKHAGFHWNALYSPWRTWSEVLARFMEVKDDPPELMVFTNQWLAEVWHEEVHESTTDEIRRLALPYAEGTAPDDELVRTAGVDVQKDHFWVVVRAWGFDFQSWLVTGRRLESWEGVWALLRGLKVRIACVDAGNDPWEVYEQCLLHQDIAKPVRGANRSLGIWGKPFAIRRNAKTAKTIPGFYRWDLDTQMLKDRILSFQKQEIWHLHQDPSEDYLKQVTAEKKIARRDKKTGKLEYQWGAKGANHLFDCEVYALAGAQLAEVWRMREGFRERDARRRRRRAKSTESRRSRQKNPGNWFEGML